MYIHRRGNVLCLLSLTALDRREVRGMGHFSLCCALLDSIHIYHPCLCCLPCHPRTVCACHTEKPFEFASCLPSCSNHFPYWWLKFKKIGIEIRKGGEERNHKCHTVHTTHIYETNNNLYFPSLSFPSLILKWKEREKKEKLKMNTIDLWRYLHFFFLLKWGWLKWVGGRFKCLEQTSNR